MPNVEEPSPFGALLRHYRIAAGSTQEALAERTGLGVRTIQHLEAGAHLPHRGSVPSDSPAWSVGSSSD
jgi:transcriptional regulator with XRE-family HTH domain